MVFTPSDNSNLLISPWLRSPQYIPLCSSSPLPMPSPTAAAVPIPFDEQIGMVNDPRPYRSLLRNQKRDLPSPPQPVQMLVPKMMEEAAATGEFGTH